MKLTAQDVRVHAGGKEIVKGVSFELTDGDWLMLVGPNGAGKSTLVGAISGGVSCTGDIRLDGESLPAMRPAARARRIGVLDQQVSMTYAFSVEEVVAMGRYAHRALSRGHGDRDGQRCVDEALGAVGLAQRRHQNMLTLSGGERQRAFLAQALCQSPDVLILDEPGNHLDLAYEKQLFELIDGWRRVPGRAVICVVHDLSLARLYGTHALLMNEGSGVWGTVDDVLTPQRLSQVWGMDVQGWMRRLHGAWKELD